MNTILNKTIEQSENLNKSKNLQQYSQSLNCSMVKRLTKQLSKAKILINLKTSNNSHNPLIPQWLKTILIKNN